MNTLSAINNSALSCPEKLIKNSEEVYKNRINQLAQKIILNPKIKIILMAGPSGSGKTTSAHILTDTLKQMGKFTEVISLDNFYLDDEEMPLMENGKPDYESVYSLDIAAINRCVEEIISLGRTKIPLYNFEDKKINKENNYRTVYTGKDGYIIIEGLHALNPVLTDKLTADSIYKVYVSINCSVFDDNGDILLTSRKMRLARRLSRDFLYRNTSAEKTLSLWTGVVSGEEKYLYPFKDLADFKLLTFHSFEPCIFKDIIIKLLSNLPKSAENYDYAMLMKNSILKFASIDYNLIPDNSLIREFVKGGIYEDRR